MRRSLLASLLVLVAGCAGAKPHPVLAGGLVAPGGAVVPCLGPPAVRAECTVLRLVAYARSERDVVALSCDTDKLVQIRAYLAARRDYPGDTPHDATIRRVIEQRLEALERAAMQCVGEDFYQDGEVQVVVERE